MLGTDGTNRTNVAVRRRTAICGECVRSVSMYGRKPQTNASVYGQPHSTTLTYTHICVPLFPTIFSAFTMYSPATAPEKLQISFWYKNSHFAKQILVTKRHLVQEKILNIGIVQLGIIGKSRIVAFQRNHTYRYGSSETRSFLEK